MKKIAFVCQRYGLEVNGGSELHCRQLAERLIKFYDVNVYTTCAIDYSTWKNEYKPGMEVINGIKVHRFPVAKERNMSDFNKLSSKVLCENHSESEEIRWIEEQGPYAPELLGKLKENHSKYEVVIFMTYLYYD